MILLLSVQIDLVMRSNTFALCLQNKLGLHWIISYIINFNGIVSSDKPRIMGPDMY